MTPMGPLNVKMFKNLQVLLSIYYMDVLINIHSKWTVVSMFENKNPSF